MNELKLSDLLSGTYAEVINSMSPFSKLKNYEECLIRIHISKMIIEYAVTKNFRFYDSELDKFTYDNKPIKDRVVKEWKGIEEEGERIRAYHGVLDITLK